jgi:beta-xylosidase
MNSADLAGAPVPSVAGPWRTIYEPQGRVFPGPDGQTLRAGAYYHDWTPNDHTFIQDRSGLWHAFGITGPASEILHEAEWQAFHITGQPDMASWREHKLALPPQERPGDRKDLWAPFVAQKDGLYRMFFGPERMAHAVSEDLFAWRMLPPIFEQEGAARDAWVTRINGLYHMVYVAHDSIWLRTSQNLTEWAEKPRRVFQMRRAGSPESPMLIPHAGLYYLFWTIYDGTNTAYDNRTFVYVSTEPGDFSQAPELTMLEAHAPEVFIDNGRWFISSAEWPVRGVSLARLTWQESRAG